MALIVRARLSGIDESLEEAAADLYAPPFKRFTQITLPLMLPAVLAGGLLAFTLSLDNTVISSFVAPSGHQPWPVYVFSAVKAAVETAHRVDVDSDVHVDHLCHRHGGGGSETRR